MESRPMSAPGRMGGGPCENCVLMEEYRLRGERRGTAEAHLQADIFGNKNLVFLLRKGSRAFMRVYRPWYVLVSPEASVLP